jgi:serine/threonine-protein kinase HipA
MKELHICPATLKEGFKTYSPAALRYLFNGKRVPHTFDFSLKQANKEQRKLLQQNRTRISISGVQEKFSLKLEKNELRLTDTHGTYILKPIPKELEEVDAVPANEHLTMQIAGQVYKINVAKCALIFFADGSPAYLTRRFDVLQDGRHCLKEDFASLLQKTKAGGNKNYKYEGSYLDIAHTIERFIPAATIAKERLFELVVFNYLFSNGDAHLKNFSVIDYQQDGFYQLSPAYDLVCTRLHIEDSDFALEGGLYEGDYQHASYSRYGYHAYDDFFDFGLMIGLNPKRLQNMLLHFLTKDNQVEQLTARSFLPADLKEKYLVLYKEKRKRLGQSLSGKY